MPSPGMTSLRSQPSPVPTHTSSTFLGEIAIAPIDCVEARSNTLAQWSPPSVDFHTPPPAAPVSSDALTHIEPVEQV